MPAAGEPSLRILHIFRAPIGGLFRHVLDLARAQIQRGHAVGLICAAEIGGARAESQLRAIAPECALKVTRFAMPRLPGLSDPGVAWRVARHAADMKADILHGHGAKGGLYARLPALFGASKAAIRIYTPHGGSFHFGPGTLAHHAYMGTERRLARVTDAFAFESHFVAELFERYVGPRSGLKQVIHNGLHEAEFEAVSLGPHPADFLHLGEMRKLKGVDVLLEASARMRAASGYEPRLSLVGAGPDEDEFRALARRLRLTRCDFLPPAPAREAFKLAPVMIVASRAESLPYVVMEAAAARRDLIATRVGGIPEIMGPFADRLIAPGDPRALADAMMAALAESATARDCRVAGLAQSLAGRMTVGGMADAIIELYRQAIAARDGRSQKR